MIQTIAVLASTDPIIKQYVYFKPRYIEGVCRIPSMFPTPEAPNQVIGVPGKRTTTPFSNLITKFIPDLELVSETQWFSCLRHEALDPKSQHARAQTGNTGLDAVPGYRRVDNIANWRRQQFRDWYAAMQITKDDIWHYPYGLLLAPDYRDRYQADLSKDLPRIPFAPWLRRVPGCGRRTGRAAMGFETCL